MLDYINRKPFNFAGLDIVESRPQPKLKISEAVPMTDTFRAEMNTWLLDMFGFQENIVPEGVAYMFGNTIIMRPEMAAILSNIAC